MAEQLPVVLVSGASRGIGRGIAVRVAELGHSIVVNYARNGDAARETIKLCEARKVQEGQRFTSIQADVSLAKQRSSLLEKTLAEFGRIDALVNNAGIGPKVRADMTDMTEESFHEVLETNLAGPHFMTQLVARHWLKEHSSSLLPSGRSVIFVSSVSAEMVSLNRGEYCVSKAGLAMVAKLWAARLAGNQIQVYELRPGVMATDMTQGVKQKYEEMFKNGLVPQNRWGTPDDVGLAVKSILSGHFPFSTGSVIHIDGGLTISRL